MTLHILRYLTESGFVIAEAQVKAVL